jgi:putative two-component system response regulator
VKRQLENDNTDVIIAPSVKAALEIIKNIDIHMLIADYFLPDGLGTDIIKIVKENNPTTPTIVLSGGGNEIKMPSLEVGANLFISKPFNGREFKASVNNLLNLFDAYSDLEDARDIITALNRAVEAKDSYTEGHSRRVAEYSTMLYDAIGYEDYDQRQALYLGCLLHDIGKIGVPDDILKSEKHPLEPQEYEKIKQHPADGWSICKDLKKLQNSLLVIRNHHEKLDGSGYPDKLLDSKIPEVVQISTIADIFDALTSKRAYRPDNDLKRAFDILDKEVIQGKINKYFTELFKKTILEKFNKDKKLPS